LAASRPRRRQEDEQEPREHHPPVGLARGRGEEGAADTRTRSASGDIPGTVEGNPVFIYHDAFNPNVAEVDDLKARYRAGKVGDVEVKTKLANALNAYPRRSASGARRCSTPDRLREILFEGSKRARQIAAGTMDRVRDAMKISYR
jgi:tryptophanyl-tRNA synthetase